MLEERFKLGVFAEVLELGLPDKFIEHGQQKDLFCDLGLSPQAIAKRIENRILEL